MRTNSTYGSRKNCTLYTPMSERSTSHSAVHSTHVAVSLTCARGAGAGREARGVDHTSHLSDPETLRKSRKKYQESACRRPPAPPPTSRIRRSNPRHVTLLVTLLTARGSWLRFYVSGTRVLLYLPVRPRGHQNRHDQNEKGATPEARPPQGEGR